MPFAISPKLLKYFKGFCASPEIIMFFVYMKCRFSLSYRELEEMASIRGAKIDHATLQRWLIKFTPLIDREGLCSEGYLLVFFGWNYPIFTEAHLPNEFHKFIILAITIASCFCDAIFLVNRDEPIL